MKRSFGAKTLKEQKNMPPTPDDLDMFVHRQLMDARPAGTASTMATSVPFLRA